MLRATPHLWAKICPYVLSDYWNSNLNLRNHTLVQHHQTQPPSLQQSSCFSPCFVYVLTWCLTEAVCYFSRASIRGSWPCFTALFHLALPALPPIPLHPDQLIDTCTAWHWEPAYSLIHEMQPSLMSLSAINTRTNTQMHTRVYTDTWAEEKQQKTQQRGGGECCWTSWTEAGTASELIQPIRFGPD